MRITFVQYGDYAEAVHRFAAGGEATYYAQRYSVDFVANLAATAESVTVVSLATEPHEETLCNGVRFVGMRLWEQAEPSDVVRAVAASAPTHLVMCTPLRAVIEWALDEDVRMLGVFADSFDCARLRERLRNHFLAAALNRPGLDWVGNHNINASRSLLGIGVNAAKIIPWDWPPQVTPDQYPPKMRIADDDEVRLLYVGYVAEQKGVGDCIEAIGLLRDRGVAAVLDIAGQGPGLHEMERLASRLGLEGVVRFLGLAPNRDIVPMMRAHDAVIVASRPQCPEGLPMTIYEAYCSRTPLIASDHPMFRHKVEDGLSGLVFSAGNAESLADAVSRLAKDPALYASISRNSADAWRALQCPVKWGDLIQRWMRDDIGDRLWLAKHTLAAYPY